MSTKRILFNAKDATKVFCGSCPNPPHSYYSVKDLITLESHTIRISKDSALNDVLDLSGHYTPDHFMCFDIGIYDYMTVCTIEQYVPNDKHNFQTTHPEIFI